MKWNKLTIETTTAAEDMLSYELTEMGMEGVEIEDHVPLSEEDRKIMYVDLLPDEIAPDDGTARISCYVDEKEDLDQVVRRIRDKIEDDPKKPLLIQTVYKVGYRFGDRV